MNSKIGIFDSGIGGVTVLKECVKLCPNFEYFYYSDSIHNPYGDRSKDVIISYCDTIVRSFVDKGCKIIIIACNTASAMAVEYLRDHYIDIHFIAIEPAIKLAYDANSNGTLIMATRGTLDSDKFKKLYNKYHHDRYYLISCVGLANLIESNNIGAIDAYLENNLSIYKGIVSNVVLGCTHYPLIKKQIRQVLGNVMFYDGSVGVARRLQSIIQNCGYFGNDCGGVFFYDSTGNVEKEKRFYQIMEESYE